MFGSTDNEDGYDTEEQELDEECKDPKQTTSTVDVPNATATPKPVADGKLQQIWSMDAPKVNATAFLALANKPAVDFTQNQAVTVVPLPPCVRPSVSPDIALPYLRLPENVDCKSSSSSDMPTVLSSTPCGCSTINSTPLVQTITQAPPALVPTSAPMPTLVPTSTTQVTQTQAPILQTPAIVSQTHTLPPVSKTKIVHRAASKFRTTLQLIQQTPSVQLNAQLALRVEDFNQTWKRKLRENYKRNAQSCLESAALVLLSLQTLERELPEEEQKTENVETAIVHDQQKQQAPRIKLCESIVAASGIILLYVLIALIIPMPQLMLHFVYSQAE